MSTSLANRASILAIGTELTTGQVINRNAAWISERLVNLGAEVVLHETVADDREMIRQALDRCLSVSRLIFLTGGLGPTTDDFTRELIAQWIGQPLEFHESSWKHINDRLSALGIHVAESNRQQCYYPKGSTVLPNPEGTAQGFTLIHSGAQIWVLPGPPREVAAVWANGGIESSVHSRIPDAKPMQLFTWQCLGKSEAELGELTEAALKDSGLLIGYRAHRPFVEVKVWCEEDRLNESQPWFEKLEQAIGPWIHSRQGEDLGAKLLNRLAAFEEIVILDAATTGALSERLAPLLRKPQFADQADVIAIGNEFASPADPEEWLSLSISDGDEDTITLALGGFTDKGEWAMGLRNGDFFRTRILQSPYKHPGLIERSRYLAVEVAIKQWLEWLTSHEN